MTIRTLLLGLSLVCCCLSLSRTAAAALSDQTVHTGSVFRQTGPNSAPGFGYPSFLNATTAATRAWNFGPSSGPPTTTVATDVVINGVTLDGPDGGGYDGLTVSGNPDLLGPTPANLNWDSNAAKNNVSDTAFRASAPAFTDGGTGLHLGQCGGPTQADGFALNIAATPGVPYLVELVSSPEFLTEWKNFNVDVDGVRAVTNLWVPGGRPWSVVYQGMFTADADGIDIVLSRGCSTDQFGGIAAPQAFERTSRPILMAAAVTAVPEPSIAWPLAAVTFTILARRPSKRRATRR